MPRLVLTLFVFNLAVVSTETLVMHVFVSGSLDNMPTVVLLVLGNITFLLYDYIIPVMCRYFSKAKHLMQKSVLLLVDFFFFADFGPSNVRLE